MDNLYWRLNSFLRTTLKRGAHFCGVEFMRFGACVFFVVATVSIGSISPMANAQPFMGSCGEYLYGGDYGLNKLYRTRWDGGHISVQLFDASSATLKEVSLKAASSSPEPSGLTTPSNVLFTERGFTWLFDQIVLSFNLAEFALSAARLQTKTLTGNPVVLENRPAGTIALQPKAEFQGMRGLHGSRGKELYHLHEGDPTLFLEPVPTAATATVSNTVGEPAYYVSDAGQVYRKSGGGWTSISMPPRKFGMRIAVFSAVPAEGEAWVLHYEYTPGRRYTWFPAGKITNGAFTVARPDRWPSKGKVVDFAHDPATGRFLWWVVQDERNKLAVHAEDAAAARMLTELFQANRIVVLLRASTDGSSALVAVAKQSNFKVVKIRLAGSAAGEVEDVCT